MRMLSVALVCGGLLSGCAGPVHTTTIDAAKPVSPARYAFAPLSPNGGDIEVEARKIVAARLSARGFLPAQNPQYSIEIGVSERPSSIAVFVGDQDKNQLNRDDRPPTNPFLGLCDDRALRLAIVVTDTASGRTITGVRSGRVQCNEGLAEALPKLADAALNDALR